MKTNKLIVACAAAVVITSFGTAEDVCGMLGLSVPSAGTADKIPYWGGIYTGPLDENGDPHGHGRFEFGKKNVFEGAFCRGLPADYGNVDPVMKLAFAEGPVELIEWRNPDFGIYGELKKIGYSADCKLEGVVVTGFGSVIYRNGDVFAGNLYDFCGTSGSAMGVLLKEDGSEEFIGCEAVAGEKDSDYGGPDFREECRREAKNMVIRWEEANAKLRATGEGIN